MTRVVTPGLYLGFSCQRAGTYNSKTGSVFRQSRSFGGGFLIRRGMGSEQTLPVSCPVKSERAALQVFNKRTYSTLYISYFIAIDQVHFRVNSEKVFWNCKNSYNEIHSCTAK